MGAISWTPAVQKILNTKVINAFQAGAATREPSGLLDICGARTTDSENIVTLVLGKNFNLRRRSFDSDEVKKRAVNIYEQRAKLGNYLDFLVVNRGDAIYDKIGKILATAALAGADVAEGPTRMVEALVPTALNILCHTGQNYFDTDHPVKPGSSDTFANLVDLGALDFASYDEAEQRLAQLPDEDGRACGSKVRTLAVGSAYKAIGREIVNNTRPKDYAGGDNPRAQDGVKLVVVPDWGDEFWCVFDDALDADKPFYFVEGRALRVKPLYIDPEGAYETLNNELVWAVDGDMSVALGTPRRALMAADPSDKAAIVDKYSAKFDLPDFDFSVA